MWASDSLINKLLDVANREVEGDPYPEIAMECLIQFKEESDPNYQPYIDGVAEACMRAYDTEITREWWGLLPTTRETWRAVAKAAVSYKERKK